MYLGGMCCFLLLLKLNTEFLMEILIYFPIIANMQLKRYFNWMSVIVFNVYSVWDIYISIMYIIL